MVGAVGETASMKRHKLWKMGEDGLCCSSSAIQTRLDPSSLLEERSETPIVFVCFFCAVGYPPNWGKRPRYIDRCQEFLSHCRSAERLDPERRGLPLELRVPGRLRPPQNALHHQSHHCLSRLQPTSPSLYGLVDCRPQRNPRSSPGRQRAYHLLRISLPQPSRKSLPRH